MYPREQYLKEIISKKDNGRIHIISGANSGAANVPKSEKMMDSRYRLPYFNSPDAMKKYPSTEK